MALKLEPTAVQLAEMFRLRIPVTIPAEIFELQIVLHFVTK